jgi:hypothetical protein
MLENEPILVYVTKFVSPVVSLQKLSMQQQDSVLELAKSDLS